MRTGRPVRIRAAAALCAATALLAVSAATPDVAPRRRLGDAFGYRHETVPDIPWSIHVVRIARGRDDLRLHIALGRGDALGIDTLSAQMSRFPRDRGRPLAALNGDYFVREGPHAGDPEGLCIHDGELVSAPNGKAALWIGADGSPHVTNVVSLLAVVSPDGVSTPLGLNEEPHDRPVLFTGAVDPKPRPAKGTMLALADTTNAPPRLAPGERRVFQVVSSEAVTSYGKPGGFVLWWPGTVPGRPAIPAPGTLLTVTLATVPDLAGTRTAIGGGPALIRAGAATRIDASDVRHPRSAVGWNAESMYLVQVDGRQPGLSAGMTLAELTEYLLRLGCTEAMNLDGGGSSTIWSMGQVMNNPCEGGERPMANALVITLRDSEP